MKKIIFLLAMLASSLLCDAQNINAKRVTISDSVWLNGRWVNSFSADSTLGSGADNIVPTQGAVKKAISHNTSLISTKLNIIDTIGKFLSVNGGNTNGPIYYNGLIGSSNQLVNRDYVDNLVTGLSWKTAVQAATTTNIILNGLQTIDGYQVQRNDRILVKNQTDSAQNGIYVADTAAWFRASDNNTGSQILGSATYVITGSVNMHTQWANSNTGTITLGTTNISYGQIAGSGTYTNGSGIDLNANMFSLNSSYVHELFSGNSGQGLNYNSGTGQFSLNAIPNSSLLYSSISGTPLGGSLPALTFGTHLTGGSYDGTTAVTLGTDATDANVPSTIVSRDASGNFIATSVIANGLYNSANNPFVATDINTGSPVFSINASYNTVTRNWSNLNTNTAYGLLGNGTGIYLAEAPVGTTSGDANTFWANRDLLATQNWSTLQNVTSRGATTTNAITINNSANQYSLNIEGKTTGQIWPDVQIQRTGPVSMTAGSSPNISFSTLNNSINNAVILQGANNNFQVFTTVNSGNSYSERMRIDSNGVTNIYSGMNVNAGPNSIKLNVGSDSMGDMLYRNSSGNLSRLGIGSSGQTLSVVGGLPAWTNPSFAPLSGSANYIQNQTDSAQTANFNISGNGTIGGTLNLPGSSIRSTNSGNYFIFGDNTSKAGNATVSIGASSNGRFGIINSVSIGYLAGYGYTGSDPYNNISIGYYTNGTDAADHSNSSIAIGNEANSRDTSITIGMQNYASGGGINSVVLGNFYSSSTNDVIAIGNNINIIPKNKNIYVIGNGATVNDPINSSTLLPLFNDSLNYSNNFFIGGNMNGDTNGNINPIIKTIIGASKKDSIGKDVLQVFGNVRLKDTLKLPTYKSSLLGTDTFGNVKDVSSTYATHTFITDTLPNAFNQIRIDGYPFANIYSGDTLTSAQVGKFVAVHFIQDTLWVPSDSIKGTIPVGSQMYLYNVGGGDPTIRGVTGVAIYDDHTSQRFLGSYSVLHLLKIASNEWVLWGDQQ